MARMIFARLFYTTLTKNSNITLSKKQSEMLKKLKSFYSYDLPA